MSTAQTTTYAAEDPALRWFRRLVWAGIVANVIVCVVSIAYTPQVLELAKVDPATPLVWPRLSAMLIMLLAGFYIPAAIDPCAHRFAAVFAVVCRFAGTIFMAVVGGHYIIFGLFDFIFGAPQAILLYLAWRRMNAAPDGRASGARIVALLAGLVALGAFAWGAFQWAMTPIVPAFASDEEFFKYGSIGNDGEQGIPYPIWVALPDGLRPPPAAPARLRRVRPAVRTRAQSGCRPAGGLLAGEGRGRAHGDQLRGLPYRARANGGGCRAATLFRRARRIPSTSRAISASYRAARPMIASPPITCSRPWRPRSSYPGSTA